MILSELLRAADPIGWILGLVLFLVGIPVAYRLGRRNRQVPDLRHAKEFNRLVGLHRAFGPGVKVSFGRRNLSAISRTHLAIWNHRGDYIDGNLILDVDPLRVVVDEGDEILQVRVVSSSKPQVGLEIAGEGKARMLRFKYLEAGDGGVLEVLHLGSNAARIEGTIPGARLSKSFDVPLGSPARARLREKRFGRIKAINDRTSGRLTELLFLAAASIALVVTTLVRNLPLRSPSLASTDDFDLTTFRGQYDFAARVRDVGMLEWWDSAAYLAIVILCAFFVFYLSTRIYRAANGGVPASIVENDADPFDANSGPRGRRASTSSKQAGGSSQ